MAKPLWLYIYCLLDCLLIPIPISFIDISWFPQYNTFSNIFQNHCNIFFSFHIRYLYRVILIFVEFLSSFSITELNFLFISNWNSNPLSWPLLSVFYCTMNIVPNSLFESLLSFNLLPQNCCQLTWCVHIQLSFSVITSCFV